MPATKYSKLKLTTGTLLCVMFLSLLQMLATTHAAELVWQNNSYSHYARKEEIKNILSDFFASQGIGVICSKRVKGKVSGNFKNKNPEAFFKHLTDAYNLVWYYDGAAVYIYSAHEMTSRILNPGFLNMKRFKQHLIDLDIYDPKFAIRMIEKERIIYISGPQRYVDLISEMAVQLDTKAMAHGGMDDIVKIFPLKYAWADDKTMTFRNKEMSIPGVVTMLNNLIAGATKPNQVIGGKSKKLISPLSKLRGKGLKRNRPKEDDGSSPAPSDIQINQEYSNKAANAEKPVSQIEVTTGAIQADPRQNAVVVRDREEKMPYYEQIIKLLDAPVSLVEIRATIMDINRNDLQQLGVQWEFVSTNDQGENITKGGLNTSESLHSQEKGLQLPTGNGLNIATILGDASDFFLAKVNALQDKGNAKILSRPSVLTLNNIEAQLEHSQTFYVRLQGEREVDLYDIDAGVVLRVTPHIIEEKSHSLVKLAIQIEDGELTEENVDKIPVVTRSIVNTQAVVGENESLLIGGYKKERNSENRQGIPCLGDVPLFGWLFKKSSNVIEDSERLFLITPTIVPYGSGYRASTQKTNKDEKKKIDGLSPAKHETKKAAETSKHNEINQGKEGNKSKKTMTVDKPAPIPSKKQ